MIAGVCDGRPPRPLPYTSVSSKKSIFTSARTLLVEMGEQS